MEIFVSSVIGRKVFISLAIIIRSKKKENALTWPETDPVSLEKTEKWNFCVFGNQKACAKKVT